LDDSLKFDQRETNVAGLKKRQFPRHDRQKEEINTKKKKRKKKSCEPYKPSESDPKEPKGIWREAVVAQLPQKAYGRGTDSA